MSRIGRQKVMGALLIAAALGAPLAHAGTEGLDDTDLAFRQQALRQVLAGPLGNTQEWSNIATGRDGTLKAVGDRAAQDGRICREVKETIQGGSSVANGAIVACRPADGTAWQVVQSALGPPAPVPADIATPYQAPADISADPPQTSNGLNNLPVPVQVWINGNRGYNQGSGSTTTGGQSVPGQ